MARLPALAIAVPRAGLTQQTPADHAIGATSTAERILQDLDFRTLGPRDARAIEMPHGRQATAVATCGRLRARSPSRPTCMGAARCEARPWPYFNGPALSPKRLI